MCVYVCGGAALDLHGFEAHVTECMRVCVCVVSGSDMIVCDQDSLRGRLLFFASGFRDSGICLLSSPA